MHGNTNESSSGSSLPYYPVNVRTMNRISMYIVKKQCFLYFLSVKSTVNVTLLRKYTFN